MNLKIIFKKRIQEMVENKAKVQTNEYTYFHKRMKHNFYNENIVSGLVIEKITQSKIHTVGDGSEIQNTVRENTTCIIIRIQKTNAKREKDKKKETMRIGTSNKCKSMKINLP